MENKKLLVVSDTHGCLSALRAVLTWANNHMPPNDTIACAAFAGDGVSDLSQASNAAGFSCEWKFIRGNNDYNHSVPDISVFDFNSHLFFMCHGHRHSLYSGYHALLNSGKNNNADVVIFGHTHVPYLKRVGGILIVNPGSVGRPRSRAGATFAVIECVSGEIPKAEFFQIGTHGTIRKVKIP
ncbi:MAG: YfcE family phosphodiesterase [Treponema sp.]|nr:YfcE family phosphodiesterase [Treponema sp.]MCL2272861.1 YfcE family phosphodiesterase [Treponema sp.]